MNIFFLLCAFVCTFFAGRLYQCVQFELQRPIDDVDRLCAAFDQWMDQRRDEMTGAAIDDALRDKKEVSLNMIREDMGFGGEYK